ncbi:bifunctional DNA primase/polymerase [Methylobacterium oxalidis]|uniref:bifunctional DNA primase/polymerase n=1 Tax=Methylobacterium oxalidis TaxID=944322 RepID=UPI003314AC96
MRLIGYGLRVFPLQGVWRSPTGQFVCTCGSEKCQNPGKHPLASLAPRGLKNATTCQSTVERWFTRAPAANVGLATGLIIVLDVDPRHGGDESLRQLEAVHGPLPLTWRVLTGGGGEHIFFRPPAGVEVRNSAGLLGPGLDVRGVGGYVVAPSSLHASGRTYEWSVDHHPDETPLAPMPDWMLEALGPPATGPARPASEWRQLVAEGVVSGARNNTVARLTGLLLRKNVDALVALELMQAFNAARCQPPLSEEEITRTVGSIALKELKRREVRDGVR